MHALPVLDALRRVRPDSTIGWVVEELSAPLLERNSQLDKVYAIPRKRWRGKSFLKNYRSEVKPYFERIRADRWDVAIDLQGLTKSALVAKWSGARERIGFRGTDAKELSALLNNRRLSPPVTARHVVQKNLSLLRGLGIEPPEDARAQFTLGEDEKDAMRARLREAGWRGEPMLALNPGAGWETKRWPPELLAGAGRALASRHSLRPLVLWGPGEEPLRDGVLEGLGGFDPIAAPRTSIRELAVLISLMSMFVGGDTGPTHLAAALGVPTISFFGGSDGARNAPWPLSAGPVVQRTELPCVPCWDTRCRLKGDAHLACLRGLGAERLVEAAESTFPREIR